MTIEQRVEFLHQSIESHNQQLGELAEAQAKTSQQIAELRISMREGFDRIEQGFDRVQLNFDRLTAAMLGLTAHVANHDSRISTLEHGQA